MSKKKKMTFFAKVKYVIFGDKKERNPQKKRAKDDEDLVLNEFSDKDNEFYTDEVNSRKKRSGKEKKRDKPEKIQQKKRKPMTPAKRRIRNILSFSIVLLVVLSAVVVLSLTVLFKTHVIEVTGTTKYSANEIISTSGLSEGDNIFLAPKALAAKRIEDKYPYVEKADVNSQIPDTLVIVITEAKEAYMVKVSEAEYLTVGTNGKILEITNFATEGIPVFIGLTVKSAEIGKPVEFADDNVLEIISEISTTFTDNGYTGITQIDASDLSALMFTYDNRIVVKLGLPENLDYKIRTAMTIINEKLDIQTVNPIKGKLDVSKCYDTKKSYFKEEGLGEDDSTADNTANGETTGTEPTETQTETANNELSWEDLLAEDTTQSTEESVEPTEAPTVAKLPQDQWYVN